MHKLFSLLLESHEWYQLWNWHCCRSDLLSFSWQCLHFLCGDSCVTVAFGQKAQLFIAHTSILAFHHLPAILWWVSSGIVAARCVAGPIEAACSQTGDLFAHTPTPPRTCCYAHPTTVCDMLCFQCAHLLSYLCVRSFFFLSLSFLTMLLHFVLITMLAVFVAAVNLILNLATNWRKCWQ